MTNTITYAGVSISLNKARILSSYFRNKYLLTRNDVFFNHAVKLNALVRIANLKNDFLKA